MPPTDPEPTPFAKALAAIDAAHSLDPRSHTGPNGIPIPYELHYAQRMTAYMTHLCAAAGGSGPPSEALQLAVRAQHFRRWEVPRSSYPMTKLGYHAWRSYLQRQQADQAAEICRQAGLPADVVDRVAALVRKEGLRGGDDAEVQVLEDAACLVFLDEQLVEFEKGVESEEKVLTILRKTWAKMGEKGKEAALNMDLSDRAKELVKKALDGN